MCPHGAGLATQLHVRAVPHTQGLTSSTCLCSLCPFPPCLARRVLVMETVAGTWWSTTPTPLVWDRLLRAGEVMFNTSRTSFSCVCGSLSVCVDAGLDFFVAVRPRWIRQHYVGLLRFAIATGIRPKRCREFAAHFSFRCSSRPGGGLGGRGVLRVLGTIRLLLRCRTDQWERDDGCVGSCDLDVKVTR